MLHGAIVGLGFAVGKVVAEVGGGVAVEVGLGFAVGNIVAEFEGVADEV